MLCRPIVKAYDTANHELLLAILEKYGVPPKLRNVIKRLYTDLKVKLKLGKVKIEICQSVGVRQGDNMAPVLFLFLMSAVSELVDQAWDREGVEASGAEIWIANEIDSIPQCFSLTESDLIFYFQEFVKRRETFKEKFNI